MNVDNKYILPLVTTDIQGTKNMEVFKDIIGQNEAIRKLIFFADSHSEKIPIPTLLFTGSQGLGKSFMAQKIATALGREVVEVNCGTILTAKDFVEGVLLEKISGEACKTLLLDEAHKLSSEVTTILLTMLNPTNQNKNHFAYKNWVIEYDFAKVNTILATTDAHMIFRPLVNRCVEVYFRLYTNEDLYKILSHYLPGINITCDKEDVSYACRGRARDAFLLSQHINRYCIRNSTNELNQEGWNILKEIFGIHAYGLNSQEIEFLRVLEQSSPISCNNIAIRMGVNAQNIESEIEIRPRELGFVESGTRGRCLTEEGMKYLKKN